MGCRRYIPPPITLPHRLHRHTALERMAAAAAGSSASEWRNLTMDNIMTAAGLARTGAPRAMDGKVALITGSTSGIGLGIANVLASAGAMIVLNGIADAADAEQLCQ